MAWELTVEYPSNLFPDRDYDIETLIDRRAHSSGVGLGKGASRDMQFSFDTKPQAEIAQNKIKAKWPKYFTGIFYMRNTRRKD